MTHIDQLFEGIKAMSTEEVCKVLAVEENMLMSQWHEYVRGIYSGMRLFRKAEIRYEPRLYTNLYPSLFFTEPTTTGPDYVKVVYPLPVPYRPD